MFLVGGSMISERYWKVTKLTGMTLVKVRTNVV